MPTAAVEAILEIFTWVGFSGAVVLALVALVARLADGSWVAAQAVISDDPEGRIARWFGQEGRVGRARLTHEQEHALVGKEVADVWVRLGRHDRMRLTHGSPLVRFLVLFALGFAGLGILAVVGSLVLMFLG